MNTAEDGFEVEATIDQGRRRQETARQEATSRTHAHRSGKSRTVESSSETHEETPLLDERDPTDQEPTQDVFPDDFAGLPWYKRPSIFWVLAPYFFVTLAYGGVITPKLNLQLELICRQYFVDRQIADPTFAAVPIDFGGGGANQQCRIPEVQSRVSVFQMWASLIAGLLSAIASPTFGLWSDRFGRKPILMITSAGAIFGEIITICAATYPETFPVNWLLVAYAVDGLTGSFIVAMAVANSYAADCTPPHLRNVSFGYFHGCLFTGFALGPILAGYIVKATGQIVVIFYTLLAVHCCFVLFVALFVPESLSERRRKIAHAKHLVTQDEASTSWEWSNLNPLEPLRILWPTGPGSSRALRMNLLFLSAVDTIVFGVAMGTIGVLIIYVNYQFGWGTFESGRFISIVNAFRVFCLVVVLPTLTRWFQGGSTGRARSTKGSDLFDLSMIRIAVLFDFIGYLGYCLARQPGAFIVSGVVAAMGGIGSPTLQSALTKHVPGDNTGQLLGAIGLLHALARVVAPTVFSGIYAVTVGKFTQAVYVCLAATFGLAFVLTWFIRPHGE